MTKRVIATCSFTVYGMNIVCPLCHVYVRSGERHDCEQFAKKPKKGKKQDADKELHDKRS